MLEYFDTNPTHPKRAVQVWLILIACAYNRQTLTYSDLASRIGYGDVRSIGKVLDYVYNYCKFYNLPPLTGLVVNKNTGLPGKGMGNYSFADQEQIFTFDWYNIIPPNPEELKELNS